MSRYTYNMYPTLAVRDLILNPQKRWNIGSWNITLLHTPAPPLPHNHTPHPLLTYLSRHVTSNRDEFFLSKSALLLDKRASHIVPCHSRSIPGYPCHPVLHLAFPRNCNCIWIMHGFPQYRGARARAAGMIVEGRCTVTGVWTGNR